MSTHTPGTVDILSRLKFETQTEHDEIERKLDLMSADLTRTRYLEVIERFYGFYCPLEESLQTSVADTVDIGARVKTPLLELDLEAFGKSPRSLPVCRALPALLSPADRFGCLYVMEGATLGGQFISRHISLLLDVTPERGGRFFHGYGEKTGRMWQSFRSTLNGYAAIAAKQEEVNDQVVASALATFRALRHWCCKISDSTGVGGI